MPFRVFSETDAEGAGGSPGSRRLRAVIGRRKGGAKCEDSPPGAVENGGMEANWAFRSFPALAFPSRDSCIQSPGSPLSEKAKISNLKSQILARDSSSSFRALPPAAGGGTLPLPHNPAGEVQRVTLE